MLVILILCLLLSTNVKFMLQVKWQVFVHAQIW